MVAPGVNPEPEIVSEPPGCAFDGDALMVATVGCWVGVGVGTGVLVGTTVTVGEGLLVADGVAGMVGTGVAGAGVLVGAPVVVVG